MKMSKFVMLTSTALALALLPVAGQAQSSNPVTSALKATLQRSSGIMAKAAEEMPAEKYKFRPTAGSMTFGHLILHIGMANRMSCHMLTGAPAAPKMDLTYGSPKAQLVAQLKESFDYCSKVLANFNDSKLGEMRPFFGGRKVTGAMWVLVMSNDWADHYSQEAAYLRANGMLPPTAHHGKP
jgi:uncharacterized damage-inducible protein DinB